MRTKDVIPTIKIKEGDVWYCTCMHTSFTCSRKRWCISFSFLGKCQ